MQPIALPNVQLLHSPDFARDQTDLCVHSGVCVCVRVSFIGSENGHTPACPAFIYSYRIGFGNQWTTYYALCASSAAPLVSSAVTDFPQQINAHAVAMGINGCVHVHVCVRETGWQAGRVREDELVSNVIETSKINANYLVFQFVTHHYSAQLINADFFHAPAPVPLPLSRSL